MSENLDSDSSNWLRRTFLKGAGAVGIGSLLPIRAKASSSDTITLGDFEESLDEWKTNGGVELDRISESVLEPAVTEGTHALRVRGRGDMYPLVWNATTVADAAVDTHPYLLADVATGGFEQYDSLLVFQFRYHYDRGVDNSSDSGNAGNGKGRGDPSSDGENQAPVVESDSIRVPRFVNTTLAWDLSDLTERQRRNPKRIDITWHPAAVDPKTNPAGQGPKKGGESYVYLDNVRLSDSRDELSRAALTTWLRTLRAAHGLFEYEFVESGLDSERGRLVFNDGTEIATKLTIAGDRQFEYTVGDETYTIGGGWDE